MGVYGGTFDPVHYGHLRIAEESGDLIGLTRVIFVPSGTPRLRVEPIASRTHRSQMLSLAIHGNDRFLLDNREIHRDGISTTVESLREFRSEVDDQTALCFLLGIDAFIRINQWHSWRALFDLCHIIVVPRPGYPFIHDRQDLHDDIKAELVFRQIQDPHNLTLQANGFVYTAHTSLLEISASYIRSLVTAGKSIRYLLPESVADYIKKNGLYSEKK